MKAANKLIAGMPQIPQAVTEAHVVQSHVRRMRRGRAGADAGDKRHADGLLRTTGPKGDPPRRDPCHDQEAPRGRGDECVSQDHDLRAGPAQAGPGRLRRVLPAPIDCPAAHRSPTPNRGALALTPPRRISAVGMIVNSSRNAPIRLPQPICPLACLSNSARSGTTVFLRSKCFTTT